MPKVILLPVTGTPADADTFATAVAIGRLFDAHFLALHTRPDVRRDVAALAASDGGMTIGIDSMIQQMESDADTREKAAAAAWSGFMAAHKIVGTADPVVSGLTGEWLSETGTEADYVAEYGRIADLVVIGRGEAAWGPDFGVMEAALMDTGKPVVIAPRAAMPVAPLDGTIGIAWKDTREAGGAVAAALPLLDRAKQIVVFVVAEGDDGDKSHLRLIRMLGWHNPNVAIQTLHADGSPPATVLCDAATKAGCGLLVMGGYGHTRIREAVFGGVTRAILEDAPLPIYLAH